MTLTPLILIPGLLCDAILWQAQVEGLADVAAAIVPDMTLDESVEVMAGRVLAAAPPSFALAGLSMGGYVAFEIMRQAPQRVTRLALLSTSASPDSAARATQRRRGIASVKHGRFLGVTTRLLPQLVHTSRLDGPVAEAVQAMAGRVGGAAFLRQQQAILTRPDSRPTLAAIHVPTVVAVGDSDALIPPAEAEAIHRGISGSRLHVFPECGHLPTMERPEETSQLLRQWLSDRG
ncbi:alpha/beta fold hydrolase [Sphingosinicella rhizophila]|uniref:Alpha/beta fold hydrolase n=1 Tax=Sphingosinicella rhizophila TaxID=3050082 RepID=A0ABU3Q9Q9_9SPHN|nr:alpha/beta fold hydrolase [Sphingosinicella sp. GR2756]MDT9600129.1 alpha/beta fold hydrolase [Sphingosinicella sp. GR2756]